MRSSKEESTSPRASELTSLAVSAAAVAFFLTGDSGSSLSTAQTTSVYEQTHFSLGIHALVKNGGHEGMRNFLISVKTLSRVLFIHSPVCFSTKFRYDTGPHLTRLRQFSESSNPL